MTRFSPGHIGLFALGLFATTEELQSGTVTFGHSAGLRCEPSESLMLLELAELVVQQTQAGPSYTKIFSFAKLRVQVQTV